MMRYLLSVFALLIAVAGCTSKGPQIATPNDIAALTHAIIALSPDIAPREAARAASLSFSHTQNLAIAYQITDAPLIHNAKVNAGTKPRGLCYHWAEDMEARLKREGFTTLSITRAIANSETRLLIDHSTAVITAKGGAMQDGIIIDPWRWGGRLFWSPVADDTRYEWKPRIDVLRKRGLVRYAQRSDGSLAPLPGDLTQ